MLILMCQLISLIRWDKNYLRNVTVYSLSIYFTCCLYCMTFLIYHILYCVSMILVIQQEWALYVCKFYGNAECGQERRIINHGCCYILYLWFLWYHNFSYKAYICDICTVISLLTRFSFPLKFSDDYKCIDPQSMTRARQTMLYDYDSSEYCWNN